ncbi:hypothetical protein PybrP1_009174 [[Pythium] brassicae (nom. inval.)]|nr:hypothetical protein PybrP1_009174 [[Pythium] brassicae (nom. inval.)]
MLSKFQTSPHSTQKDDTQRLQSLRVMPHSESPPRSRHRSRSRSPRANTRNRRSRSASRNKRRSPSRSGSASDDSARRHKREHKKKHKKHKKHKKRRVTESGNDSENDLVDVPLSNPHVAQGEIEDAARSEAGGRQPQDSSLEQTPQDVHSFFERVRAQEAAKEAVGTVHASGVRALNPTARVALEQWECVKRGCGEKNPKRAAACSKCGAMKRLSEWR